MSPVPPQDVRAVLADGREVPLECRYVGRDGFIDQWEAVYTLDDAPKSVLIGMLPGRCSVSLAWERT